MSKSTHIHVSIGGFAEWNMDGKVVVNGEWLDAL
jgi:uncharacterized protein YfaQ (DUF2300 family)